MEVRAIDEYNDGGHLVYFENLAGAFVRGKTLEQALDKALKEIELYSKWIGRKVDLNDCKITIVQKKFSRLQICDADSDVIFDSECLPLTVGRYECLKELALKSAKDFLDMYNSIENKDDALIKPRKTFYGDVPVTARQMYEHTKNVNSYYFGEIGVSALNEPDILTCRIEGFKRLEEQADYLENRVYDGSFDEKWSLRKVLRRFIWHDRIHAKAMYKAALKICGASEIENPFCFDK